VNCVTCGDELHLDRAEKYDYCTKPECQERNAKGLDIVAVGVNKAADQYVVLNERTKQEMARGRYKKETGVPVRSSTGPVRLPRAAPTALDSRSPRSRPRWSEAQQNLVVIYRSMGMKPHEIAKKLGVTESLATQILLAATRGAKR
jgi:hypothetical protein